MKLLQACSPIALAVGLFGGAHATVAGTYDSVAVLQQFSELMATEAGQALLAQNLEVTVATNNNATDAQVAQAISDNTVNELLASFYNGENIADALGSSLGAAMSELIAEDALPSSYTQLMLAANLAAQTASSLAKNYYGNGTSDGETVVTELVLSEDGSYGIYDQAYGIEDGNPYGDSRPYQASDEIVTYTGTDYFGEEVDTGTDILDTLDESPAFPSGHTTYGITSSLLLAILIPERYQELVTRGLEYGNSRVVLGAHYALDVIGARVLAYKTLADLLNNDEDYTDTTLSIYYGYISVDTPEDFSELLETAGTELREELEETCGGTIDSCIDSSTEDRFSDADENETDYTYWLTYGMDPIGDTTLDPVVPEGAEVLIASRFPYLTDDQLVDVLASTELSSGYVFDDGSGWARLNLYAAANGYGYFQDDVTVYMDAADGGFSASDTWSNDIYGDGGLTKQGTGTLELTGDNSYTGDTVIEGGELIVNGVLSASTVTVSDGGALGGAGMIAGLNLSSGGTLAVGNSIGTLVVAGDATLDSGSTMEVEVDDAGNADLLYATGSVEIDGGDVVVEAESGDYDWKTDYVIVIGEDGVTGAFDSLTTNFAFLDGSLGYSDSAVTLTLTRNDEIAFADYAQTANQRAVANAVAKLDDGNDVYDALMTASVAEVAPAYDSLSGSFYPGLDSLLMSTALDFGTVMQDHSSDASGAWASVYGRRTELSGDSDIADLDGSMHGIMFGYNAVSENDWRFQVAGNVLTGSADGAHGEDADLQNYGVGLLAERIWSANRLQFGGNVSFGNVDATRNVDFSSLNDRLKGDYDTTTTVVFAEFQRELATEAGIFAPFAGLSYVHMDADGFSETGGASALTASSATRDGVFSTLGLRWSHQLGEAARPVALSGALAWQHALSLDNATRNMTLAGAAFTATGQTLAEDSLKVDLGVSYQVSKNGTLDVAYSGEFADAITSNALQVKFAWAF